ncbi:3-deoxy-D-manno-octulosonic acid transferase [Planctomycetota bacterium]
MLLIDIAYVFAAVLGLPVLLWLLVTKPRVRAGPLERLAIRVPRRASDGPCIWVHGVSVGEVLTARPLVREIERELPEFEVVISATTSTGLEVAGKHFPDKLAFYYPLDLSLSVERMLKAVRPSLVVLVELEVWPNFLSLAAKRGIPVVIVNGRITERSVRGYRLGGSFMRWLLAKVRHFCVQTEVYRERFVALGVDPSKVLVTGTMKYDALVGEPHDPAAGQTMRRALGIAEDAVVVVGGSTHEGEEEALVVSLQALRPKIPGLRLVLVPRHTERTPEIAATLEGLGERVVRKTYLDSHPADRDTGGRRDPPPVVLGDTMGELSKIYATAEVVFVGGSLVRGGGQNMLEPCGLGKAVLFGPHTDNFRQSVEQLLAGKAAIAVEDAEMLTRELERLLTRPCDAQALGERARRAVESKRGAAKRTVAVLQEVLEGSGLLQAK